MFCLRRVSSDSADACSELCSMQDSIWHWAVARLLLILWEHDHEIIRHAHGLTTDDEVRDERLNGGVCLSLMSICRTLPKSRVHPTQAVGLTGALRYTTFTPPFRDWRCCAGHLWLLFSVFADSEGLRLIQNYERWVARCEGHRI